MFDHVGISVSDLAASERFYRTVLSVLGVEPSHADAELVEWEDWDIGATDREHPVTRGLHVGFRAPDRAAVDAFWQAGIDAGYSNDGAPGPRAIYGPDYYGGFLLDPDGNSVEAVHSDRAGGRAPPDARRIGPGAALRLGFLLLACARRSSAHRARPPRFPGRHRRCGAGLPRRGARRGLRGPRRSGRARPLSPGLLRRLRARPRRPQH